MALDYDTYVSQLSNLMVIGSTDSNFQTFLPGCIDYAEQRMYRELDLLATQVTDATSITSSGDRNFTLPTSIGVFITVDNVNVITPAGALASAGTRNPVIPIAREFIDAVYPSGQLNTGTPQFYAMASNTEIIFGPSPDAAYTAEVIGIQRPIPLSSANSSTFLTAYLPDAFMAASMVFASGYMRDFGGQGADNSGMSVSWEGQYKTLIQSAQVEEARKKFQSEGWTSNEPTPLATPPRV
jgi:hypothetical protein